MIDGINITAYYLAAAIIHLFLTFNITVKCSRIVGEIFARAKQQIKGFIVGRLAIKAIFVQLINYLVKPINLTSIYLVAALFKTGVFLASIDEFVLKHDKTIPGEAVNYSALILRKLYDINIQVMLSFLLTGIVVFYFILSVL